MSADILAVDDVPEICELLKVILSRHGHFVRTAYTAGQAAAEIGKYRPDLILLDVVLPDISGIKLVSQLKSSNKYDSIPIILLTANNSDEDVVQGLQLGADDYIVKPFNAEILNARVTAVLRRVNPKGLMERKIIHSGSIVLETGNKQMTVDGRQINLTPSEFGLIHEFVNKKNKVIGRDELCQLLSVPQSSSRVIDVHIAGLRKKLGKAAKFIRTVRGQGYKLI